MKHAVRIPEKNTNRHVASFGNMAKSSSSDRRLIEPWRNNKLTFRRNRANRRSIYFKVSSAFVSVV
jgi:hypothetical protein